MNMRASLVSADIASDLLHRYYACKAMARGYADARKSDRNRLAHARAFCSLVVGSYWLALCERHHTAIKIKPVDLSLPNVALDAQQVAQNAGRLIADFPVEDAGYLIGSIYTVMLPAALRSELGAYYTPPPLVTRMLDLAEEAGVDFTHATVIDPACGGGAFLAPVALRMIARSGNASADWTIRRLGKRLRGIEIDPFAAWMTRVLLEAAVMPLCVEAKRRLPDVVTVADALQPSEIGEFDLVIGNPPYGRTKLDEPMRQYYARSLYGHANLYGLFTDLALRLVKPKGVIAYLTPTSFLGGQYFKALRELLANEASPTALDFVSDRNGVFDDVLQETLLTTYTREQHNNPATVSVLVPQGLNAARVDAVGTAAINRIGDPWLLPRTAVDAAFLRTMMTMPTRLVDLGYTVSTGPLVWNRHKSQLRTERASGALPLIWAESVMPEGFVFSSERRNHVPFIAVRQDQPHLVARDTCVLVQRTTSKEQSRRLLAALLPQTFLDENGGAVVENHLNMVQAPSLSLARVSPRTIAVLLNSAAVDRAFRCISGSVAVSAYELNALPLPAVDRLQEIERLVLRGAAKITIERAIASCYGVA
jgi:hypothetical protein